MMIIIKMSWLFPKKNDDDDHRDDDDMITII